MKAEAGKHDFSGNCAPGGRYGSWGGQRTFSVGIFEWVPKVGGKGLKRSAVKVRVKGSTSNPEKVYNCARAIIVHLDRGEEYDGPKVVTAF